jgi:hypothetical protein
VQHRVRDVARQNQARSLEEEIRVSEGNISDGSRINLGLVRFEDCRLPYDIGLLKGHSLKHEELLFTNCDFSF